MSEWDDTTREAGREAARRLLPTGHLWPAIADEIADAVLAVVDAVPRAEHEELEDKFADAASDFREYFAKHRQVTAELERLRQAIRDLADKLREMHTDAPTEDAAAALRQLVDGGQS